MGEVHQVDAGPANESVPGVDGAQSRADERPEEGSRADERPEEGSPGELAAQFAHGVPAPANPGPGTPGVEAVTADPRVGDPQALRMTALAVPGHPDGEVDTRPHPTVRSRRE